MSERTMLKLSVRDDYAILQTCSRRHGLSPQFYTSLNTLDDLEETGTALALDAPCFAKLYRRHGKDGRERLEFSILWLSYGAGDTVRGRREQFTVDGDRFKNVVEQSEAAGGAWLKLLALSAEGFPQLHIRSTKNLRMVQQNRTLRKKFGRFVASNFHWHDASRICISDDYLPYSFFFQEERGDGRQGICGGIILHGQDDLRTAHYEIHT